MAAEDVGHALNAMADESIRSQIASGDFSGVTDLELSDDERTMLRDAAEDYPDVEGFAFNFTPGRASVHDISITKSRFSIAAQYAFGQELPKGNIAGLLM